jgi:hypothetical protein
MNRQKVPSWLEKQERPEAGGSDDIAAWVVLGGSGSAWRTSAGRLE